MARLTSVTERTRTLTGTSGAAADDAAGVPSGSSGSVSHDGRSQSGGSGTGLMHPPGRPRRKPP